MSSSEKAPEKPNFVQTCNLLSQYIKEKGKIKDFNLEIGSSSIDLQKVTTKSARPTTEHQRIANPPHPPQPGTLDCPIDIEEEDDTNAATTSPDATRLKTKDAQLTIFYAGRVLVFDDYPLDKVRELVSFAKKGSSQMSYGILSNKFQEKPNPGKAGLSASSTRQGLPPRPQASTSSHKTVSISSNVCKEKMDPSTSGSVGSSSRSEEQGSPESNGSDLPIARRSSLYRFLEKRKDRASGRGPYQVPERPTSSSKSDEQFDLNL